MTRGLIIIKEAHLADAIAHAQAAPFSLPLEEAESIFVPANAVRDTLGDIITPATLCWASGLFSAEHWAAMQALADSLPWAHVSQYNMVTDPSYPWQKLAEIEQQETFSFRSHS